jgi:hypothetical protein
VARPSSLTAARLDLLYEADGFGGEKTMRAKVVRELIDEIRALRGELREVAGERSPPAPGAPWERGSA